MKSYLLSQWHNRKRLYIREALQRPSTPDDVWGAKASLRGCQKEVCEIGHVMGDHATEDGSCAITNDIKSYADRENACKSA